MSRNLETAAKAGDISAIIAVLTQTSELKPEEYIKKTVGNTLFVYYVYLNRFHTAPRDLEDLVDGLLYIDAQNYIDMRAHQQAMQEAESRWRSDSRRRRL